MTKPVEKHFNTIWKILTFGFLTVLTLPLGWHALWGGISWWDTFESYLAVGAMFWFMGAEFVAPGVVPGWAGTYTDWVFWKVHEKWRRVAFAFFIVALMYWRLPVAAYINLIAGTGFLAWLPRHYYGGLGPVDRFVIWLGHWTGIAPARDGGGG